jgi:hypothetical protein
MSSEWQRREDTNNPATQIPQTRVAQSLSTLPYVEEPSMKAAFGGVKSKRQHNSARLDSGRRRWRVGSSPYKFGIYSDHSP